MSSTSKWQSIRPWDPRLALTVREITSVSATFVLSSLSAHTNLSFILDGDDEDEDGDAAASTPTSSNPQILSDSIAKGLSIKVNSTAWQRVLARVDDSADEAVIIIYGLMPGKQYDIEFGIVPGEERVRGQIVTEAKPRDRSDIDPTLDIPEIILSTTSTPPRLMERSPSPPSSEPPSTPGSPGHSHQTYEEYHATLQHTLSHLQSEHESLLNGLKGARRDSQKSQAALRSEITSLKRSSQKHTAGDVRAKQKARALEEAGKQALKGREEIDIEREAVEAERAVKEQERLQQERRWQEISEIAEQARRTRQEAEDRAALRVQGVKSALAAVEGRLDKLRARREKLEGRSGSEDEQDGEGGDHPRTIGIVRELEAQLRDIQLERKSIEDDPYAYIASTRPIADDGLATDDTTDSSSPASASAVRSPRSNTAPNPRNSFYSLPFPPHHPRGKRHPGTFSPHHGMHSHSLSHSQPHSQSHGSFASAPAPISAPPRPMHFAHRPHAHGRGGSARPLTVRRRSSPPVPLGERSTLSSLAPPFEPASIRVRGSARGVGGS